jgi:phage/plasmid-like protein (TIGR03299 family)
MLAQMPDPITVKGVDRIEPFLLFSNAHDGSQAVRMFQTSIRVVCANTSRMALARAEGSSGARHGWTFRHTGDIAAKLEEARKAVGLARQAFRLYGEAADLLAGFRPSSTQLAGYFAELYPDPPKGDPAAARGHRSALMGLFERGRGNEQAPIRHSLWSAVNAVTEHVDHEVGTTPSSRLESAWWGDGAKLKDRALELAVGLAEGRWAPATAAASISLAGPDATPARVGLPAPAPFRDGDLN